MMAIGAQTEVLEIKGHAGEMNNTMIGAVTLITNANYFITIAVIFVIMLEILHGILLKRKKKKEERENLEL